MQVLSLRSSFMTLRSDMFLAKKYLRHNPPGSRPVSSIHRVLPYHQQVLYSQDTTH